ncbi:DNA-directed RNA polymerase subunit alpha [Candidatus Roizmanbacteria bacterium RIFCSPHIGHO2_01_FULL_39_8]|uniref:DNA-directed RNA polymerase subunit alpha n=3 Tax=Candidatus Roizmaniibacteriota TaxID=1752723 RepID=A0A1F7GTD5_9BACT|nr:MAG: DNA-directed RNA polymerase subunit alpha [Candidatus Roizmanbacteria bacterium RIFCSPHIGHO2_01_FULL_39_8]OGK25564.1 MAG: DNA-directed RNA polymerase subunit alpha [Candidatus Roizmanbacteria bacterium RIFCSPHIGHO2_02_FULL_39_9]OGK34925.1 MAG: DNA-directed RNA polymerase subunit alpha [Candidatus Roizmanbacteria bacterium RIFCSPHIGHO2_12_FULL_39_8]
MIQPNFTTQKVVEENMYGKYVIEPLAPGFGQSLGITLRRVLLSSLAGSAITGVKIDGVSHMFSTIKGVKESSLDIILNLKQLRFVSAGKGPFRVHLSAKGQGKVTGKDVEGEADVVNKDLYIAEITTEKGKLEIDAIVEAGTGYLSSEERETKESGYIGVDAFFSPVTKVSFKVEEARVGRKSNLDRLILEIWTNGSIKPSDALRDSASIASEYFVYVLSGKDAPQLKSEEQETEKKEHVDKKLYEVIIDELNLPSRVINALLRENIETVADLVKVGKDTLTNMKGVGKKSIELIEEELKKMGIELK